MRSEHFHYRVSHPATMTKITHILFDCDNTLVLSEELAFEACADLANIILASQGITDKYTGPQLMGEFIGQNFRGMMNGLQKKYNFQLGDQTFVGSYIPAPIATTMGRRPLL